MLLGPFLFLMYINDMTCNVNNNLLLFVNDTFLYVIVDNDITSATNSFIEDFDKIK